MSAPRPPRYTQRTMLLSDSDAAALGRAVVADGRLKVLRHRLGITRNAMSELLYTNAMSYTNWERRPTVNLRNATAMRVGRFYHLAVQELDLLQEWGLDTRNLVPFHVVAAQLGTPIEVLFQWYRDGKVEAVDAGILGLWVERSTLAKLQGRR